MKSIGFTGLLFVALVGLFAAAPLSAGRYGPPDYVPPDPPYGGGDASCVAARCYKCKQDFDLGGNLIETCPSVEESGWACTCNFVNGSCEPWGTCDYNP